MKTSICTLIFAFLVVGPIQALELRHPDGQSSRLDDLHKSNMWTLVMVWSLDCVACEAQKPMISRFHSDHKLSNAQVIGIASDGDKWVKKVEERIAKRPTTFHSYLPKTSTFENEFFFMTGEKFIGTPTYLIFRPDGTLGGVHAGLLQREQLEIIVGPATKLQTPTADLIR